MYEFFHPKFPLQQSRWIVYYRDPDSIRQRLYRKRGWFGVQQLQTAHDCLAIPPEYGDPIIAVLMCAEGYDERFGDHFEYASHGSLKTGIMNSPELLGNDKDHAWRCRNTAHKLYDAILWPRLRFDSLPGTFSTDCDPHVLVAWAAFHGIPLTEKGMAQLVDIENKDLPLPDCIYPKELEPPATPDEDVLRNYTHGWNEAVGARLRAILVTLGMDVEPARCSEQTPMPPSTDVQQGNTKEDARTPPRKRRRKPGPKPDPKIDRETENAVLRIYSRGDTMPRDIAGRLNIDVKEVNAALARGRAAYGRKCDTYSRKGFLEHCKNRSKYSR